MAQDPGQIREQIAETRSELADTVQELAGKTDVKRRVRESVSSSAAGLQERATQLQERVREAVPDKAKDGFGRVREAVPDQAKDGIGRVRSQTGQQPWLIGVVAGVFILLVLIIWRRRH